ncbi:MAG: type II toxin-antitoxin system VapC family toxin [Verrucomicrobia bacterium]|nr:type II toxin-antitoxin system VapC family toxin [Verrucomicrobiota bacterium]
MIVVDVNVLADYLIGDQTLKVNAAALASQYSAWIAPSIWRYELGNVLWKVFQFSSQPGIDIKQAFDSAEKLIEDTVEGLNWEEIPEVANSNALTYNNASYVWLAQTLTIPLYTRDKKILKNCPELARTY